MGPVTLATISTLGRHTFLTAAITHRLPLVEAPQGYDMFKDEEDGCEKVVPTP